MYRTKVYYENNKQYYKDRAKLRRKVIRDMVDKLKSVPCADCKQQYPPYVMDFDHRGNKLNDVARLVTNGVSVERILAEIAKCDIVCANCHRIRTHK